MEHISEQDREILRQLAYKQLEYANRPVMEERRELWYRHNALQGERPLDTPRSVGVRTPLSGGKIDTGEVPSAGSALVPPGWQPPAPKGAPARA